MIPLCSHPFHGSPRYNPLQVWLALVQGLWPAPQGRTFPLGGTIFLVPQSTTPCCLSFTRSKWHILLIAPSSLSIPNYWEIMNIAYLSITSCFHRKKIQSCPSLKAVSSEYHPSPGPNRSKTTCFHMFFFVAADMRERRAIYFYPRYPLLWNSMNFSAFSLDLIPICFLTVNKLQFSGLWSITLPGLYIFLKFVYVYF